MDPGRTVTHALTLIPRKLRSAGRPRNRRGTANDLPTRALHSARPIRTASSLPSDPSNRTINTLDYSANPPAAPANPSLVCLPVSPLLSMVLKLPRSHAGNPLLV
jgi:hypothetical protein